LAAFTINIAESNFRHTQGAANVSLRLVGDLLNAEINEKQARSIKYQLTIAKLPLAKDLEDFQFEGTPINQTLVNDLAAGGFIAQQRNAVLVGGTGTGKTHLAIAIARSCIRSGARGRFYNVVDLVNRLADDFADYAGCGAADRSHHDAAQYGRPVHLRLTFAARA
jgi:DNA replication protein DnaC